MKLYFIRHGVTQGNLERRYVGRTDEGILEEEKEGLRQKGQALPKMDQAFVSPYLRCRQTAELLFGKNQTEIIEDFREMDFGVFEYKNYQELSGNPDYQKFIDSGGTLGFPGRSRNILSAAADKPFKAVSKSPGKTAGIMWGLCFMGARLWRFWKLLFIPKGDIMNIRQGMDAALSAGWQTMEMKRNMIRDT